MEITIPIEDPSQRGSLYGTTDRNLRLIRTAFDVRISARDNLIHVSGQTDGVRRAAHVIERLQRSLRTRPLLTDEFIQEAIDHAS